MTICEDVQARLAEDGIEAVRAEPRLAEHLAGCQDCNAVAETLSALDTELAALPDIDAPDAAVAATLEAVAARPVGSRSSRAGRRQIAGALAATLVLAAVFGVGQHLLRTSSHRTIAELNRADSAAPTDNETEGDYFRAVEGKLDNAHGDDQKPAARQSLAAAEPTANKRSLDRLASVGESAALTGRDRELEAELLTHLQQFANLTDARDKDAGQSKGQFAATAPASPRPERAIARLQAEIASGPLAKQGEEVGGGRHGAGGGGQPSETAQSEEGRYAAPAQMRADPAFRDRFERDLAMGKLAATGFDEAAATARAETFLKRISSTEDLAFQEPSGYWANTYVPGDPAMRLVRARLEDWNRRQFGQATALDRDAQQATQPFDRPTDAALALYLDTDAASVQGETRLRVQVGLKGAERLGGQRPTMNVALVVDPRGLARPDVGQRIRALVTALARAHQPGDRFSLVVAGPDGGRIAVAPEDFRHGPLQVALADLKAAPTSQLAEAIALAAENVQQSEDAVLGSSLVLLATASDLGAEFDALEGLAHRNAVGGVAMSVVDLGGAASHQVDRLVAAGQGNRRHLTGAEVAERLIETELHAASRVVARAVRLRIRLAPGVRLVDVLGSRRLEAPQAQRVRQAEQAIDRRLARNLGIAADRGQDEEGIQIVIPNFYAGDAHVVLLDVVAERPGPIADVTARYKDVVRLRNATAQVRLSLPGGEREPGPLERNVLKNLLAHEVAARARRIGLELQQTPAPALLPEIAALRELVHGLRRTVPGWSTDPDLAADERVLAGYFEALRSPLAADPGQRHLLADSLRYAAFAKLHTRRD